MSYFLLLFDLYSICIRRCCSTLTISASKEEETLTHKNIRASHYTLLTKTLLAVELSLGPPSLKVTRLVLRTFAQIPRPAIRACSYVRLKAY